MNFLGEVVGRGQKNMNFLRVGVKKIPNFFERRELEVGIKKFKFFDLHQIFF